MLFSNRWQGLLNRVNRFRWWEYYLYLPIFTPILAFAAVCLFPKLAGLSAVLIISAYSYLAYIGEFSLDLELLTRWGGALLIHTVGMYLIITVVLIEQAVKSRFGSSESDSSEQD